MPSKPEVNMKKLADNFQKINISYTTETVITKDPCIISLCYRKTFITPKKWPKLKLKVPDIFLHKPVDFEQHVKEILSLGIKFNQPHLGRYYTKITCLTLSDHKNLIHYLEKIRLPYNTFGNPTKRKMKVVVKGLPIDVDLNLIKSELKSLAIPIVRVHKMQRVEYKWNRTSLILAVVPYNDDGKKLLQLNKIMGHDVKMEPLKPKAKQCHRCQMWGHTQRYCHGKVKCVKCAGEHASKMCERNPDKEPPKCANCGEEHTASYRQCECCPDSSTHIKSQVVKHEHSRKDNHHVRSCLVTLENFKNLYKNVSYDT